jgi:hypothetical protein
LPRRDLSPIGLLFLVETGLLLTKVGFVLDMFVLDVFRRFVLGMFFFLVGLFACHWFAKQGDGLIASAKLDDVHGNQDLAKG